ncbi:MAG: FtsX-like permease family protein [bacterium]|nr:FtsX-like permease family protein [bacterium]
MNLSTARSATRAREVGLRKVFGARRRHLANQFLGESVLIILTALVIAIFLVNLTLTFYNNFVGINLRFDLINDYQIILILLFTAVFVGLTAGSYPALYISSFKPVTVLRNILNKGTKGRDLRNYLVIGQFAISIILIICTIIVREQLSYINNTDLGYDKDNVIVIKILDHSLITAKNKLKLVKNELVKHSEISGVTSSSDLPSRIFSGTSLRLPGGQELSSEADENRVDINFVDLYDIEIIKGRNFSRDFPSDNQGTFIINETLADMLGYDDPINKELIRGRTSPGTIIGVLKNFNAHSLYQDIGPVYFWFQEPLYYQQYISVKTSGINTQETLDFIKTKTDELLPGFKVEYNYYSDIYNNMYSSEHKLKTMLTLFAMLGIFISCLGIFGLISITTINRTKEIGIRKALGSSVRRIIFLITKDFLKLIVISNLFAWPIAWFAMDLWLQDFAFKTQINISVFIIAGFMALVIMLLSTILQTIKAAAASPVDTLRYE